MFSQWVQTWCAYAMASTYACARGCVCASATANVRKCNQLEIKWLVPTSYNNRNDCYTHCRLKIAFDANVDVLQFENRNKKSYHKLIKKRKLFSFGWISWEMSYRLESYGTAERVERRLLINWHKNTNKFRFTSKSCALNTDGGACSNKQHDFKRLCTCFVSFKYPPFTSSKFKKREKKKKKKREKKNANIMRNENEANFRYDFDFPTKIQATWVWSCNSDNDYILWVNKR